QACLEQRRRGGDAVKHIAFDPAGARFVDDLDGVWPRIAAGIFDLDAGIFLVERLDQRTHRLVYDQRRVPDDLAFSLGRLVEHVVSLRARASKQHRHNQGDGCNGTARHCGYQRGLRFSLNAATPALASGDCGGPWAALRARIAAMDGVTSCSIAAFISLTAPG